MSEEKQAMISFESSRFGALSVPEESVIELPNGLIGFPDAKRFVMLEHKHPFSWFHCVDNANLAFVVIDGGQFIDQFGIRLPVGDPVIELESEDECAVLVLVTVRSKATETTANIKAPVFVNVRNRKGVQIIFDDPKLTTRFPLVAEEPKKEEENP